MRLDTDLFADGAPIILLAANSLCGAFRRAAAARRESAAWCARIPEAHGMFSTNTGWPSVRETPSARSRAMTSVAAKGPVGTMSLIGRLGQLSACAALASATMAQARTIAKSRFIALRFCFPRL
ncbi:MAG: hypothetical protein WB624_20935 [Xanthobacteraceae bacterium]